MMLKKTLTGMCLIFIYACQIVPAHAGNNNYGMGQTIQITTELHAYTGKPSWLLVIRDVDHNQNIPYVFDFKQKINVWMANTYGNHYLITASTLQFSPYRSMPCYSQRKIRNFCNLESHGHIMRGESIQITITGKLSPYSDTFRCRVTRFKNPGF